MAIGEAGSLSTNSPTENAPITVTFAEGLRDPVIALSGTQNGGHGYTLRVTDTQLDANGNTTGFTFQIEEWEYLDGPHPATETINWLAVEQGVHTLPDGRVIEAGTASATDGNTGVSFAGSHADPPVVLTGVMSDNDATTVDADPFNVTNTGFTLSLQEEEGQDGTHAAETVGWIAIEPGTGAVTQGGVDENTDLIGLGGTFTDPVTVVETQTINGPDTAVAMLDGGNGSSTVGSFLQEEQSDDSETGHINETIGAVTFEQGLILCFTPGTLIDTPHGPREITTLGAGDLVLTRDAGPQPVRYITRSHLGAARLAGDPHLRPIRIRAGAIAPGIPAQDLTVSPQHRMLITGWRAQLCFGEDEVLAPARGLLNDTSVRIARDAAEVSYIHLCLDGHHILTANGAPSESLHAGGLARDAIDAAAREELFAVFPHLRTTPTGWGRLARPALSCRETRAIA